MVGTIIPVVYRDRKNGDRVLALHIAGYIFGAGILGGVLGFMGLMLSRLTGQKEIHWAGAVIGAISLCFGARELGLIAFPMPASRWQVPAKWRSYSLGMMAIVYGTVLGAGVANRIAVSTFHAVVLWAILSRDFLLGAIVLAGFGLGRAMPFLWIIRRAKTLEECFFVVERTDRLFPFVQALNGLGLALVGSCFLSSWLDFSVSGGLYGTR